jgi:Peptidase family M48
MSSAGPPTRLAEGPGVPSADLLRPPDETVLRFALLVGAALAASAFVGNTLYLSVRGRVFEAALAGCIELAGPLPPTGPGFPDVFPPWLARLSECQAGVRAEMMAWSLAWAGLVAVIAVGVYAAMPSWKLRRRHLQALHGVEGLQDCIASLSAEAGLRTPPRVVGDPLDSSTAALVFGGLGRRFLALPGGMLRLFQVDRPAFRTIVLHELAHLRNRDVGRTYYALSIWVAFLAVGLLPFVAVTALPGGGQFGLATGWRVALLVGLVYLTRNALLRSRELYADARAGTVEPKAALANVLGRLSPVPRWRAGVGVHPSPELRLHVLRDPIVALRPSVGEALALGMVTSVLYAAITTTLTGVADLRPSVTWWAALAVAPLAVGVLGLGVWRYTAAVAAVTSACRTAALGLGFGCGLLMGESLSVFTAASAAGPVAPWYVPAADQPSVTDFGLALAAELEQPSATVFGLPWVVAVLASSSFFAWWLGAGAGAWRDLRPDRRQSGTVMLFLAVAAFVWVVWLGALFALRDGSPLIELLEAERTAAREAVSALFWEGPFPVRVLRHPLVWSVLIQPLVAATVIVLWAYPLMALLIRNRRAGGQASSIRYAVHAGTLAGLAFLPLLLALRLVLRSVLTPELRALAQLADALYVWTLILALSVQIVVSAVVAARVTELAVPLALLAVSISALLAAAGALGATVIASCAHVFAVRIDPAGCSWVRLGLSELYMAIEFMVGGALLAIPAAAAVQVIKRTRRRRMLKA